MFLRPRPALLSQLRRTYATASSPHTLLFIEHQNGEIDSGSLSALNAATQLGGPVTGVVIGGPGQVEPVVEAAKKFKGLTTILHSTSPAYEHPLPEIVSPLLKNIIEQSSTPFTHVVSTHSANSKSLLPRLAATFDVPAISDVTSVSHSSSTGSTTFTRPIYAGNAIATIEAPSDIKPQFFTVRVTAFPKAPEEPGDVKVEKLESIEVNDAATLHLKTTMAKSDRPDLAVASKVVSGGRALKNAETFQKTLDPLADVLGAAVGASRAAVDAGYADNSLQVGQTGKIVAPELYIAVGISGAIQHLAGMKDSKMIVAINKDPEAPIFQVADLGLVADLYEAVPELTEKLKK
jgi:electron transfer flavoprotein alpha subunit